LDNSISIWFQENTPPFEVKLYATKYSAKYFKRRPLPTQVIEKEYNDGSIEFSIKITHDMEILPIIKYWIPHLYIIEPQRLKEDLKDDLDKFLKNLDEI